MYVIYICTALNKSIEYLSLKLQDLCVSNCAQKYIHTNHKIMEIFMEVQPIMVRRRMEEINMTQAALETQNQQVEQNPQ